MFRRRERVQQEQLTNGKIAARCCVPDGGGDMANMQQETMFDFCMEGLMNHRLKQGLQRPFCTCLLSEMQLERTLRLSLRCGVKGQLIHFCHELSDWTYRKRKDSLKKKN